MTLMNWADWAIVGIIGISSLISIARGFVKEAISLAIWAVAFFVAVTFHERLAVLLQDSVQSASLRYLLSYVSLFIATLIVGSMVKYLTGQLVKMTGLSGADRMLGVAFGLSRGIIIVMAILIFLPMGFPIDQEPWWQQSILIPEFLLMEQWSKDTFNFILDSISQVASV
jgi:membrane protein required for colicin V production